MNIEKLAQSYDDCIGPVVHVAEAPTVSSVKHIEKELGFVLPKSLVQFAAASKFYGSWLASLGPDFDSLTHIITINNQLRDEGDIPPNFIAINVGYDEDYSCIDTKTYDNKTREYFITYWAKEVSLRESSLSPDFPSYMQSNIEYWTKGK